MCMERVDRHIRALKPTLAWKVVDVSGEGFSGPYYGKLIPPGRWVQTAYYSWRGFHTFTTKKEATEYRDSRSSMWSCAVVPVAIAGRARFGVQALGNESALYGYTAEWIYYLEVKKKGEK